MLLKVSAHRTSQVMMIGRLRQRSARTPACKDSSSAGSFPATAISATFMAEACRSTTAITEMPIVVMP